MIDDASPWPRLNIETVPQALAIHLQYATRPLQGKTIKAMRSAYIIKSITTVYISITPIMNAYGYLFLVLEVSMSTIRPFIECMYVCLSACMEDTAYK